MTLKKFFGSAAIISIIGVALWICKKLKTCRQCSVRNKDIAANHPNIRPVLFHLESIGFFSVCTVVRDVI